MYLGHSFLAFALVGLAGYILDVEARRTLLLAALAAAFGLLPDVDMWRTLLVFLLEGPEGVFPIEEHVFVHSWVVHRTLTHSTVTGAGVALAAGLLAAARAREPARDRAVAAVALSVLAVSLLWFSWASAGVLGFVTMGLFLAAALGVALAGVEGGAAPAGVAAAAAAGVLTHPLGDLWMGRPAAFLYPLSASPPIGAVRFSADPVVHFLVAVGVEVGLLWACVLLGCALVDRPVRSTLSAPAAVGALYAAALLVVPPPTFAEAYQFASGLFALSLVVSLAVAGTERREPRRPTAARAFVTGLATFTLGLASYGAAHALAA